MVVEADVKTEVTVEEWDFIRGELEALLKTKQKKNEDLPAYALRLALGAADDKKITDEQWEDLDEERTQKWVNGAIILSEKNQPVPLPAELLEAAPDADADADDEGDEPEQGEVDGDEEEEEAPASAPKRKAGRAASTKKDAKPGKPKRAASSTSKGRPSALDKKAPITILVKPSPYKKGSKIDGRYALLAKRKTVGAALEAGVGSGYVRYFAEHGVIKIG